MQRSGVRSSAGVLACGILAALCATPAQARDGDPAAGSGDGTVLRSGGAVLGTVSTQVAAVVPLVGELALPAKFGASGAQAEGEVRRANSQVLDLGILGTLGQLAITGSPTLTRLGIPASQFTGAFKLPPGSAADSRSATQVHDRPAVPNVAVGPVSIGGADQQADATKGAVAHARTELENASADLGAVRVEVNGGVADTVADATRVVATTSLGELRFLSGTTPIGVLAGVVWRYEQTLDQPPVSSFEIGSGSFGSAAFPLNNPDQTKALAAAVTNALAPLGVSITFPEPRPDGGLTPLRLALANSPAGASLVRPAYDALLTNAVNQAEASVIGGVPESGLGLTVANVVLGALTGKGGVAVELGGVSGSIGRRPVEEFHYPGSSSTGPVSLPGAVGSPRPASTAAGPPSSAPAPVAKPAASTGPRSGAARLVDAVLDEGLPALVIVLAGLASAIGLATVDRRRIDAIVGGGDTR